MRTNVTLTRRLIVGCCLLVVLGGMLIACGCTQQPPVTPATTLPTTATPTPTVAATSPPEMIMSYNESANNSTISTPIGKEFRIDLRENPTTGYMWNATVTSGLVIQNDSYTIDNAAPGMVGVGGTRSWLISGTEAGLQHFRAIYSRPWENVTGSEESFVLNVNVVKP